MNSRHVIGVIIISIIGLLFLILGILLYHRKCPSLILSKADAAKQDTQTLYRFMGRLLMILFFCILMTLIGVLLSMTSVVYPGLACFPMITICAAFYLYRKNKSRLENNSNVSLLTPRTTQLTAALIVVGTLAIPIGALVFMRRKTLSCRFKTTACTFSPCTVKTFTLAK